MKEPTFDKDGYPTEETLQFIQDYKDLNWQSLIDFILAAWYWLDYAKWEPPDLELHTGGWSGNESIISALQENFVFWGLHWMKSERGGHFYFRVKV